MGRNRSGSCAACFVERKSLHRDHIIPKWKGGTDIEDNEARKAYALLSPEEK